ncbi:hypothetical protein ACLB2K_016944 [Fragaria x ananassa]
MAANGDEATKNIFTRCLMKYLHIPFWQTYRNFIRKVNSNNGQDLIREAFDSVGYDIVSGPEWQNDVVLFCFFSFTAFCFFSSAFFLPTTKLKALSSLLHRLLPSDQMFPNPKTCRHETQKPSLKRLAVDFIKQEMSTFLETKFPDG